MQSTLHLISLMLALSAPFAHADEGSALSSIPQFHAVSENLYRGGRPGTEGVEELARLGIKTIIDIDDDSRSSRSEARQVQRLGMHYVARPMNPFRMLSDRQVDELLALLQDESLYPIFIHCHHGQDRTGLTVGLYRIEVQGWTAERAYREMLKIGFHPELTGLDRYFKRRAGFHSNSFLEWQPALDSGG